MWKIIVIVYTTEVLLRFRTILGAFLYQAYDFVTKLPLRPGLNVKKVLILAR